jgi:hypothetical protein
MIQLRNNTSKNKLCVYDVANSNPSLIYRRALYTLLSMAHKDGCHCVRFNGLLNTIWAESRSFAVAYHQASIPSYFVAHLIQRFKRGFPIYRSRKVSFTRQGFRSDWRIKFEKDRVLVSLIQQSGTFVFPDAKEVVLTSIARIMSNGARFCSTSGSVEAIEFFELLKNDLFSIPQEWREVYKILSVTDLKKIVQILEQEKQLTITSNALRKIIEASTE